MASSSLARTAWESVFERIADTPVKTKLLRVRKNSGNYLAEIEVTFAPNLKEIKSKLSELLNLRGGGDVVVAEYPYNQGIFGPSPLSERLLSRLKESRIWLEVSVGEVSRYLNVAGIALGGFTDCYEGHLSSAEIESMPEVDAPKDEVKYCLRSFIPGENHELMIRGGEGKKVSNPVVLELTREQAETARRVSAEIHLAR